MARCDERGDPAAQPEPRPGLAEGVFLFDAVFFFFRQRNPNHDQFWLNEVLKPRTFLDLKAAPHISPYLPISPHISPYLDLKAAPAGVRRSWVAEALAARRNGSATRPLPPLPVESASFDASAPRLRAVYRFERRFGGAPAELPEAQKWSERPKGGWAGGVRPVLGTFPIARVSNGRTPS